MLLKILPPVIIFFLGFFLKEIKILNKEDGENFLKLVFYVSAPASILITISSLKIDHSVIYLPFLPYIISLLVFILAFFVGKRINFSRQAFGSYLTGVSIMNTAFALPFFAAAYGSEGFAKGALFDAGSAVFTFTFAYYIAVKYGQAADEKINPIKKILISPPLWAIIVAFAMNFTKVEFNSVVHQCLVLLSGLTVPIIMLSLGIYFSPKFKNLSKELIAVAIRVGFGLVLGFVFAWLLGLQGVTRAIVIVGSAGPIGYNSLIFSKLENLDEEFAASAISLSFVVTLILIPILLILIKT